MRSLPVCNMLLIALFHLAFVFHVIHSEIPLSSCLNKKPFKMTDNTCATFNDVCVKKGNRDCDLLQSACKQCLPSEMTIAGFLEIGNIKAQLLETKNEQDKNNDKLAGKVDQTMTALKEQGISAERFQSMLIAIILIIILVLVLLILEMRFKLFTKCSQSIRYTRNYHNLLKGRKLEKIKELSMKLDQFGNQIQPLKRAHEEMSQKLDHVSKDIQANVLKELSKKLDKISIQILQLQNVNKDIHGVTTRFKLKELDSPINLIISDTDNAVHVKRQIMAQLSNKNFCEYKVMKMKYNGEIIDDNQFLLPLVWSNNALIHCEFDYNLKESDIVVLKLTGSKPLPDFLQVTQTQKLSDIKSIVAGLTNSKDFKIFRTSNGIEKLKDDKILQDYSFSEDETLTIIVKERLDVKLKSIFDERNCFIIESFTYDEISSLEKQFADNFNGCSDDFRLFYDGISLREKTYIFELPLRSEFCMEFCLFKNFKDINIGDECIGSSYISEMWRAYDNFKRKKIMLRKYKRNRNTSLRSENDIVKELETFLITKSNSNFVQVLGVYKNDNFFYIALENMVNGSLKKYVDGKEIEEKLIAKWSKQTLECLKYLHDFAITLCTLKLWDMFLDQDLNVKICGFVLSKHMSDDLEMDEEFKKSMQNDYYMSPEFINNEPYGAETDVWSLGVNILEIVTGEPPYPNMSPEKAVETIGKTRKIDYNISSLHKSRELSDFLDACLEGDRIKRASTQTLLEHNFITKHF